MSELVTVPPPVSEGVPNGDEPGAELEAAASGSVLAALRRRARELREQQNVTLDIPGYDGYMLARFRAVSIGRIYGKRTDGATPINPDWTLAADVLGSAVDDVLMRDDPESEESHPIFKDQPARFDDDLVEALDLRPAQRTARAVLVALCGGGALGESRLWALYMQYQGWLLAGVDGANVEGEAAAQAVGEHRPH